MAIERFIDEIGTDLNKFQVTTSSGETYEITLLRKANISQVGTLLNATKLNELVDEINSNTISISQLSTVARTGSYNDLTNKPTSLPASDVYAWAKASTKPSYTASEVGAYSKRETDERFEEFINEDKDINCNKITAESFISTKTTIYVGRQEEITIDSQNGITINNDSVALAKNIPTKLSQLTNDNRNMYMNSASWTNSPQLPSRGLYILKVSNSNLGGGYINLGLVNYDGNNTYWSVYYGGQNYRVYLTSGGGVNFQQWTGNSTANLSGTTYYYYIKLS